ncbi:hypothetical protein Cgig2_022054 [Carnegiea gigantea]|uniref:Uncharacterized protein n=1 Tax=Carnegiea gigantea TaxID=171969 RepID=A0A9Q1QNY8_9CARY|nr:hypothetical protein Cgig2_022054 [Carnegiea gigantea]
MKKPPDPGGSSCFSHSSCFSLVCCCSSAPISQKHGERDRASTDSSSSSDSDIEAKAAPDSEAESHPQPDPEAASDVDEIDADSGAIVSVRVELKGGKIRPFYCQICFPLPLAGFESTLMDLSFLFVKALLKVSNQFPPRVFTGYLRTATEPWS